VVVALLGGNFKMYWSQVKSLIKSWNIERVKIVEHNYSLKSHLSVLSVGYEVFSFVGKIVRTGWRENEFTLDRFNQERIILENKFQWIKDNTVIENKT
jgi:hypothetical protein